MHKTRILLVDDVPANIRLLREALAGGDHQFLVATSGAKALEIAAGDDPPDLILLDVMMPEMDGLEVCRRLKAEVRTSSIPVIFLTAMTEIEDEARGLELGAVDYITKPFSPSIVRARVRAHLDLELRTRELRSTLGELDRRNRFIRQTFGRYLSDEVVTQLLEAPEGLSLGGEKRELTILMSDLRGFTAMSEQLAAEEVVRIINIYLGEMTEIILEHQGTIDEFLGDAILAFFGAPIRREDDVARALACAVAMQQAMQRVNRQIAALGYSEVSMGIGLHTGPLVVGNIGSERRSKYGAVGHNINLASRIESFSVGGQILASGQTVEACGAELRIDRELTVSPKGVREPITLYEVGGVGAPYQRYLPERGTRELRALPQPISARFKVVDGKQCGDDALEATLWRLTGDEAELRAPLALDPMTNLRISLYEQGGTLIAEDLYAKVTRQVSASPPVLRVKFTYLPAEVRLRLRALLPR